MGAVIESSVPCNGCTRCCHGDAVRILPHEPQDKWLTVLHPYIAGARMLAHRPDDGCIYLGDKGCTIHEDKPQQCREMDCRNIAKAINFTTARKWDRENKLRIGVWQRGRELLRIERESITKEISK